MSSRNLKNWKIFNILKSDVIQNIRVAVVCGDNAVIATFDNNVYTLGSDAVNCSYPFRIIELCEKDIKTFACSTDYILALTNDGLVYSWRDNKYTGGTKERIMGCINSVPNTLFKHHLSHSFIMDIAGRHDHFLALTNKGKVYVWINEPNSDFKRVNHALTNKVITCISCGKNFSIVITHEGKVYGWGDNTVGQLGIESYIANRDSPYEITALDAIVIEKVVCGYSHTLALSKTGVLYVWGQNNCGQLGLNTLKNSFVPVQLETKEIGKVQDIAACSASHISAAIAQNNQVFIWGQCMGRSILVPTCTMLKCLHDVFAYYAWPRVTYKPLIFYDERNLNLVTSLRKAFNDPDTSDLVFEVQKKSIYVHKVVLNIRCQHFRTMFQDFWAESRQNVIEYDQFSHDVYKSFLNYLYTDKIDLISHSQIAELLSLADMYNMCQLKNDCSQMLIKNLTIKNVVYLYNISVKHNAEELQKYCFTLALNHMTAVVQTPDFIELDKDIITNFLIQAAKAGAFKT